MDVHAGTIARRVLLRALMLLPLSASAQSLPYGIGPWELGMSPDEVTAFDAHGPYTPVEVTGGLETMNARLPRGPTNVSFVFGDAGLDYIQVWYYEGEDFDTAKQAALELYDELSARFGGVSIPGIAVNEKTLLDRASMEAFVGSVLRSLVDKAHAQEQDTQATATITFDLVPASQPTGSQLDGQIIYSSRLKSYWVLLFQDRADRPPRRAPSNIKLDPL